MNEKVIEIKNLTYHYPNQTKLILKKVNLSINRGDWVSLIGANGSGKSTLAKLIVGLLDDEEQQIQVFGKTMNDKNGNEIRSNIGMVFQNPENQFVSSTVLDDVAFGLENQGMKTSEMKIRVAKALETVEMNDFINQAPNQLSGGQNQRVALASVLAQQPSLIILDEATGMLDPTTRSKILKVVHRLHEEQGTTVLAITHDINETLLSDKIVILNQGEIVAEDKPNRIYVQTELLRKCGLEVPLTYQVQQAFSKNGIKLSEDYLNEEELIKQLWKLN
ncbi:energy-coupling factor transporter ATPase [Lactobacillus sanfranciscensis]|uniref:Cobalt import ATP-binding protein cbiO 2 n=1 Tax=Fructilactobacillus sanfranciscensis (strain TMW 1.1304) TaxID=714313 RepID=G2KVI3_FRUST|nr:energy-coupling factor transporter ATPase [Fructilactobacillus sanfranciscensis]AEN98998.1 Cobalt import ATP-binding protein cbiO 2 [Fructilactobacillus sanfranciscensis TMW 1.1304]NDR75515.1 energy-coupling factor transporter ATPase [Fructilactobacillus sanfranciscensis]NDR96272.1 energy-coupling factor transporter ATPase [Fructilactobacillus sanfranciscensis]NDS04049.1 energy-coupling factor transporter ATPase [Fructilactobacillus sanfranciscensis]POH19108.1 energy-coupling factor transpo